MTKRTGSAKGDINITHVTIVVLQARRATCEIHTNAYDREH